MVTIDRVRAFALTLPRTTEGLVRDRVKFRVGRIVYLAFSPDETIMGFGFPKEEREALVRSDPTRFLMPTGGDLRYHGCSCLETIAMEMRKLVSARDQGELLTVVFAGTTRSRGRSGIRTHERVAPLTVFKTVAFVRSAILP